METNSRGHRIYYEAKGSGEPLILLPGQGGSIRGWEDAGYHAALADRFRVISIDPLGHGQSEKPYDVDAYDRSGVAADVVAVMDAEGHATAHVWGYSRGSAIATNVVTLFPGRVRSLIVGGLAVVSTSPTYTGGASQANRSPERMAPTLDALRRGDWDAYWTSLGYPATAAMVASYAKGNDPVALAALIEASTRPATFTPDFSPFRGRMLVFAGTNDLGLQAPGAIETFTDGCKAIGARIELLEGLTHPQAFQRSDLVLPFAMEFLAAIPAS